MGCKASGDQDGFSFQKCANNQRHVPIVRDQILEGHALLLILQTSLKEDSTVKLNRECVNEFLLNIAARPPSYFRTGHSGILEKKGAQFLESMPVPVNKDSTSPGVKQAPQRLVLSSITKDAFLSVSPGLFRSCLGLPVGAPRSAVRMVVHLADIASGHCPCDYASLPWCGIM